jgi:hypothetical protein
MDFNYFLYQPRKRRNFILDCSEINIRIGNPTRITVIKELGDDYYNSIVIIPQSKKEETFWICFFKSLFEKKTIIIKEREQEQEQEKQKQQKKCIIL